MLLRYLEIPTMGGWVDRILPILTTGSAHLDVWNSPTKCNTSERGDEGQGNESGQGISNHKFVWLKISTADLGISRNAGSAICLARVWTDGGLVKLSDTYNLAA